MLAFTFPDRRLTLLDGGLRRATWLAQAVIDCGLGDRVTVVHRRAEDAGRDATLRERFPLVVSRSFGPPPVTAECAAGLVSVGGSVVVSEPPGDDPGRWPAGPLAEVGLAPGARVRTAVGLYQILEKVGPCPGRFPRRIGVPAKRPLYRALTSREGQTSR